MDYVTYTLRIVFNWSVSSVNANDLVTESLTSLSTCMTCIHCSACTGVGKRISMVQSYVRRVSFDCVSSMLSSSVLRIVIGGNKTAVQIRRGRYLVLSSGRHGGGRILDSLDVAILTI